MKRHEVRRHEVRTPLILHAPAPEILRDPEARTPVAVETLVRPAARPPVETQPAPPPPVVVTPAVVTPAVPPPVVAAPPTHAWWLHHQGPRAWWLHPNPHAVAPPVRTPAPAAPHTSRAGTTAAVAVAVAATVATGDVEVPRAGTRRATGPERVPLSAYLLRLQTVKLRGWQRVLLFEGTFLLAVVVALADFATAWLPVVVPFAVGAMLKLHDVVLTQLHRNARTPHQR